MLELTVSSHPVCCKQRVNIIGYFESFKLLLLIYF